MPPREAAVPDAPLYRVARYVDPLDWPAWEFAGQNRFDDPIREFRVLYTAERIYTCFIEILAPLRPDL